MLPPIHKFYQKSSREKQFFYLKLGLLALSIISFSALLGVWMEFYWLPIFILPIVMTIFASFVDVPSLKSQGKLTYYSPLFLAEQPKKNKVTIHGGTLFDYYFVLDRQLSGNQRTKLILWAYLKGLLELLKDFESSYLKADTIRGTSYIINARTAKKLGLQKVNTDFIQLLIIFFNYANLTCSLSLAKRRLSFPNINHVNTYEGKLQDLYEKRDYLTKLEQKLFRSLQTSIQNNTL